MHWRSICLGLQILTFLSITKELNLPHFIIIGMYFLFDYNRDLLAIILKLIDFSTSKQVVDFTTFDCEFDDLRSFAESKKEA